MIIQFTEENKKHLAKIQAAYKKELQRIEAAKKTTKDTEERKQLLIKQQALIERRHEEELAYIRALYQEEFNKIEGGAAGIIEDAKQQIPEILRSMHSEATILCKTDAEDTIRGFTSMIGGKLCLDANFAYSEVRDHLELHINALISDKAALQELLEVIIAEVENSPYTDNTEIKLKKDADAPDVARYRRNPLGDIASYGIMNDKVNAHIIREAEDIFHQETNGQIVLRWAVNQAPQKLEEVPVYIALSYEGKNVKLTRKMSAFDKQVCEAVATRFYYWQHDNPHKPLYLTPQEIWRTMNGKATKEGKAKPSQAAIKRICDSLDKMRFTRCYMDISEELRAHNVSIEDERITEGRIDTYLLNSSKVEFTTDKGNKVQGYRISEEPILYTYNKAKNHILYVPYEMLDTSKYTSDSENVAEFKGYLLQQIQLIKNTAEEGTPGKYFKRNSIILLDTIYRDTGILPPEERIEGEYANEATRQQLIRRERKKDRQKIEGMLEAWKEKDHIKDYVILNKDNEPIKEKQAAKGYKVIV